MGSGATTSVLRTELGHVVDLDRPYGVGLIGWRVRDEPTLLDTALEAGPALLSVSFGDDFAWVATAQEAGVTTARAFAAVLAAGATGAWIGTAFAVCRESLLSEAARAALDTAAAVIARLMS